MDLRKIWKVHFIVYHPTVKPFLMKSIKWFMIHSSSHPSRYWLILTFMRSQHDMHYNFLLVTCTLFITLTWTITLRHHSESILVGVDSVSLLSSSRVSPASLNQQRTPLCSFSHCKILQLLSDVAHMFSSHMWVQVVRVVNTSFSSISISPGPPQGCVLSPLQYSVNCQQLGKVCLWHSGGGPDQQ